MAERERGFDRNGGCLIHGYRIIDIELIHAYHLEDPQRM